MKMKFIKTKKDRDFLRAARVLVSLITEEEIEVTETLIPGAKEKYQYDFFHGNEPLKVSKEQMKKIESELKLLKGVETYIGCGYDFKLIDVPGVKRHPNHPIWYSTQPIQIQEMSCEAVKLPDQMFNFCKGLDQNKFVARTQMIVAMLQADIDMETIKETNYTYSSVNFIVNCCIDPDHIHLEEADGYLQALKMRQILSTNSIASMIHPSGRKPVVAYISNSKFDKLKNLSKTEGYISYKDLSISELGLKESEGLIPINANFE